MSLEIDISLGGFAEEPSDIDGTEEEMEIYNRCLASEYYQAFFAEDYDLLGEISGGLLDTISSWYTNYDDKCYSSEIQNGLIKTINNRTFIDAVVADKRGDYAEVFIDSGNMDVRLFVTVILYGNFDRVLCSSNLPFLDKENYFNLIESVLSEIEKIYLTLTDNNEKITLLERVKNTINHTKYNPEFGKYILPKENAVIKALRNQ